MKKSKTVVLGAVMVAAIAACKEKPKDEWVVGDDGSGRTRDTAMHGHSYRHYGGFWYPIVGGFISPRSYNGASASQISQPSYRPTRTAGAGRRAGGFGSSARGRSVFG